MGRTSRDYLDSNASRDRRHGLHTFEVKVDEPDERWEWGRKEGLIVKLTLTRKDPVYDNVHYQNAYLTEEDVDTLLPLLMKKASATARFQVALDALSAMTDKSLHRLLYFVFAKRR
jgi:hypothetical protein